VVDHGQWQLGLVSVFEEEDAVLVDYQDCQWEKMMSRMYNPPLPGENLCEDILPALG
jgi:hypothetical protein